MGRVLIDRRTGEQVDEGVSVSSVVERNAGSTVDFSMALGALKRNVAMGRKEWGSRQYVRIQFPDSEGLMTRPYFYMVLEFGDKAPWHPTSCDVLADDWYMVD